MGRDLLGGAGGAFFRGNLHCHSNRSDGLWDARDVVRAYREAGYDFVVLSDHFEADYGWQVTDTRPYRQSDFTTIVGAELSSAGWRERQVYWAVAAGLPLDFDAPPEDNHALAIERAADTGAFVTLLHPGLNNLPLAAVGELPAFDAVHAVEIYNHAMAVGPGTDQANGAYLLDGLLEHGRRLLVTAGDDAHFNHPADRFGGWVEVRAEQLDEEALVAALKRGDYYSTQGPRIEQLLLEGDQLHVQSSPAYCITLGGAGGRWLDASSRLAQHGEPITETTYDVTPFRGSYCRVTVTDSHGRRAWSNPIWQ